jgi:hypothetical protein
MGVGPSSSAEPLAHLRDVFGKLGKQRQAHRVKPHRWITHEL